MMDDTIETRKMYLSFGFREMAARRDVFSDNHGNLSVRLGKMAMIIKPSGLTFDKIRYEDMCVVRYDDVSGRVVDIEGELNPSVDTPHHINIYMRYPEIMSICHSHSDYVVARSVSGLGIPCLTTEQADNFGNVIPCTPYYGPDDWGKEVVFLKNVQACLLARHGGLTYSKETPLEAVKLAIRMEDVARKAYIAQTWGKDPTWQMSQEEILEWRTRYLENYGQKK